ncbi:Mth938-like domain-containing protein [Pelagibacterium xiamenense]|uniref:Mth938-like domain-containing protein n=1 Tax=Pelagibacterium xiamenense TaxID=2901140 RepID=UPI001E596888|nr:MTH938/NDUFAF3 family protein [Pelagibacterium xiamenense]MCD7061047.1 MTH938/NDUFAF3 family protein [Pelagibacterium xiamenense]
MTWEPGQGHYPHQASIDAYGNFGFRFADMSHRGSLLCLPSGMFAWEVERPEDVTLASLDRVLAHEELDVLLVGLGSDIAAIDPAIRGAFREKGIIIEAVSTGSAVRTYNVLLSEDRAVAAALIAVEQAR